MYRYVKFSAIILFFQAEDGLCEAEDGIRDLVRSRGLGDVYKRQLLDALCRYADHIDREFGPNPGQRRGYCGHPEIELSLIHI